MSDEAQLELELAGSEEGGFRYLVRLLARNLKAKVAFICELQEGHESARTLALSVDGQFLENLEYKVAGTPCEAVYKDGPQHIASGLPEQFPHDPLLKDWAVDSYLGVPFFGADGEILGHVGIMRGDRFTDPEACEALLSACAVKAAAEFERQRAGQ